MNAFWKWCLCQLAITPLLASEHTVISGEATISQPSASHKVITASDKAILHWDDFSIDPGKKLEFILPEAKASVLNRVVGKNESRLLGELISNGRLYLVNPNGIFIGKEAVIRTASFLASTLDMNTEHFLKSGQKEFHSAITLAGLSKATVTNLGTIEAWDGDIIFASYGITNEGSLKAAKGTVAMAACEHVVFQPKGSQRLFIKKPVQAPSQKEVKGSKEKPKKSGIGITQAGSIEALKAELSSDGNVYALAIKCSGSIEANGIKEEEGRILLVADRGRIEVSGELKAKSKEGAGGHIGVYADEVLALEKAKIDASNASGKGEVFLGGSFQGKDRKQPHASWTYVGRDVEVSANAQDKGDGGSIIVWADEATQFYGKASACGDETLGKGGLIEVSGGYLDYNPKIATNIRGAKGQFGTLLLDPYDLSIIDSSGGSQEHVTTTSPFKPSGGPAKLFASTLHSALDGGGNIVVQTGGDSGSGNGDISIQAPIFSTGNKESTLTFEAAGDVLFHRKVDLESVSKVTVTGNNVKFLKSAASSGNSGLLVVKEVEVDCRGDLVIDANDSAYDVGIDAGNITINSSGNISLVGSAIADPSAAGQAYIGVGTFQSEGTGSTRNITCQGAVSVTGKSKAAFIGNVDSPSFSAELRINAREVIVTGGSSSDGFALIGESGGTAEGLRGITVVCDNGDLKVSGGSSGWAHVGQFIGSGVDPASKPLNMNIGLGEGSLIIKGGLSDGAIGSVGFSASGITQNAFIKTHITIEGIRDIVVEGGGAAGAPACLGFMMANNASRDQTITIGDVEGTPLNSGLTINNATGQIVVAGNGYSQSYGAIGIASDQDLDISRNLNIAINSPELKAINLISGSQTADPFSSAGAYLGAFMHLRAGNTVIYNPNREFIITVDAPSAALNLFGPSLSNTYDFASIGLLAASSSVSLINTFTLDVADAKFSSAALSDCSKGGAFINNIEDLTDTELSRSSVTMKSLSIDPQGGLDLLNPVTVEIKGDVALNGEGSVGSYLSFTQSQTLTNAQRVIMEGDVSFKGGSHFVYDGTESVDWFIGKSLSFSDNSDIDIKGSNPKLTLLVDDRFPTAPYYDFQSSMEFASDASIKMTGASSPSDVELKLYAVAPNITTLPKVVIGSLSYTTPGLVETHTYYPDGSYSAPFSVYYKVPSAVTPAPVPVRHMTKELSSLLEEFDHLRFNFDQLALKRFRAEYRSKAKGVSKNSRATSSFDIFDETDSVEED